MFGRRQPRLGAKPNPPDERDRSFDQLSLADGDASKDVLLTVPGIYDQGQTNSCTGYALAGEGATMELEAGVFREEWSALFPYWHGRHVDGYHEEDGGAVPRSVLQAARKRGVCGLGAWKPGLLGRRVNKRPSRKAHRRAFLRRGLSYYHLHGFGDSIVRQVDAALDGRLPVGVSMTVRRSFYAPGGDLVLDTLRVDDPIDGGHRMYLSGRERGLYRLTNSWGKGWRGKGHVWVTPQFVSTYLYDFAVITGWNLLRTAHSAPAHFTPEGTRMTLPGTKELVG